MFRFVIRAELYCVRLPRVTSTHASTWEVLGDFSRYECRIPNRNTFPAKSQVMHTDTPRNTNPWVASGLGSQEFSYQNVGTLKHVLVSLRPGLGAIEKRKKEGKDKVCFFQTLIWIMFLFC